MCQLKFALEQLRRLMGMPFYHVTDSSGPCRQVSACLDEALRVILYQHCFDLF